MLAEDYCGRANGTFMITTENVPCGTDGVSCTKSIKFKLHSDTVHLVRGSRPYITRGRGAKADIVIKEVGLFYFIFADTDGEISYFSTVVVHCQLFSITNNTSLTFTTILILSLLI